MPKPIRPEIWFWPIFAMAIAWLLSPFWLNSQIPAFRDGFHFYIPQAVWLDACYERGEYFPQWNPNEGLGSSVAGQPTWQLYYPLRAIWFVPGLNLTQRFALFVAVHLLLAVGGMLRVGKQLQLAPTARWLSAVAFSLSCPVLFQLNNWIYLCSATWIAWGLIPIMRLVCSKEARNHVSRWCFYGRIVGETATVGCLMTLAGDPHTAVNFAILLFLATVFHCWHFCFGGSIESGQVRQDSPSYTSPGYQRFWLPILTVSLLAITAFQIQAALPWFRISSRAGAEVACTDSFHPAVAEILTDAKLVQPQRVFDFSLSPWNLPTVIWPTWSGHFQPTHSRWVQAIPSEGRMWIPSLYVGIIPALLALYVVFGSMRRKSSERFLIAIGVLSTFVAMGNYSLVWLLRNVLDWLGASGLEEQLSTDAKGSFYGILTAIIPGYDGFRYPAKWSVWMVASFSLLAACGFNRLVQGDFTDKRYHRWLVGFIALSGFLCVAVLMITPFNSVRVAFQSWLQQAADPLLGTPDLNASINAVVRALIQPVLLLVVVWVLLSIRSQSSAIRTSRISGLVVLISLIDLLFIAPQWISSTAMPFTNKADAIGRAERLFWANTSRAEIHLISQSISPDLQKTIQLQELFLMGKLTHLQGQSALHATGSIEPQAMIVLKRWLQRNDSLQAEQPKLDSVLRSLGVTERLIRSRTGRLEWKTVDGAGPLCEFVPDGSLTSHSCSWKWLNSDELQVEIDVPQNGTLLVRQFNDGGWSVRSSTAAKIEIAANELFIVCSLTAGRHRLVLARK
jgi:hypothetical protein